MKTKNTRISQIFLGLVFILVSFALNIPKGSASIFSGGSGTSGDPYQIGNCAQLQLVGSNLNKSFILIDNIDCSDTINWNSGQGFVPISTFTGTFDGRNHTISGLYMNRTGNANGNGLFGTATGATIKNFKLTSANITFTSGSYTGGIVGNANTGTNISGVSFSGNLTGLVTGGLVGFIQSRSTLSRSSASGNVTDNGGWGGGLIGFMRDSDISDCYTEVALVGNNTTGGFSSRIWTETGTASVVRSYAGGTVKSSNYRCAFVADAEDYGSGAYSMTFTDLISASSYVHDAQSYKLTNFYGNVPSHQNTPIITNGFFDANKANGGVNTACGAYGTQSDCTNINTDTLYNTSTAAPFKVGGTQKWDFDTVWQTREGGLPTLRNPIISPDAPTSLATSNIGGEKATLSWTAPTYNGGANISKYYIYYRKSGDSSWTQVDTGSTNTSRILTGLTASSDYEFKVAAYNSAGTGLNSATANFSTTSLGQDESEPVNVGPTLEKFQDDMEYGFIEVDGLDPSDTSEVIFTTDYTIISGDAQVVIPSGTEMTKTGGGSMDFTTMTLEDITESMQNAYVSNIAGAVSIGIPSLKLSFSHPISVTIPVGDSYNGQTLTIYYQNANEDSWNDGLSCVVVDGLCIFETDHATKYSAGDEPILTEYDDEDESDDFYDEDDLDEEEEADSSLFHTPFIAIGKHWNRQAKSTKVNTIAKTKFSLRGKIPELAKGRVELYKDDHKLKRVKIGAKGKWRVPISLKRGITRSFQIKYFNSHNQLIETTPEYQIRVTK